jgi:lauroyl/myristoyl acyltransferase
MDGIGLKIGWRYATKYKKKMRDNLTATYHNTLTDEEKELIARESLGTMLRGFIETFYCVSFYNKKFDPWIELEGGEHLEQALALGKGVIGVSAHLGTFTLIGAKLHTNGFHLTWIMGGQTHPRLAAVWKSRPKQWARAIVVDTPIHFHREILRRLQGISWVLSAMKPKQGGPGRVLGRPMARPWGRLSTT